MQCFTPMVRYYLDKSLLPPKELAFMKKKYGEDFKTDQRIIPRYKVFENLKENENYLTRIMDKNKELEKQGSYYRYQLIGCQHCWACKLKKSAEWASRLTWESKYHEHKYFITLTYDEEHVPIYENFKHIDKDGNVTNFENDGTWNGTLEPDDVKKFLNTMRKYYERQGITGIKYFYCGEYGETTQRPHYHMILFGAPLDINQFYDWHVDNKHKKFHWKSKEIERWWGKGMIDVAEVEWNSCAYVARYCMKKISDENDARVYAEKGKIPEFVRMSRRPGIGMRYYEENKYHIYENDEVIQKTIHGETSVFKPPKAFDRKFEAEEPELFKQIKECRLQAAERNRKLLKELNKGISDLEQLQREAEKTITKGQMLKRMVQFD